MTESTPSSIPSQPATSQSIPSTSLIDRFHRTRHSETHMLCHASSKPDHARSQTWSHAEEFGSQTLPESEVRSESDQTTQLNHEDLPDFLRAGTAVATQTEIDAIFARSEVLNGPNRLGGNWVGSGPTDTAQPSRIIDYSRLRTERSHTFQASLQNYYSYNNEQDPPPGLPFRAPFWSTHNTPLPRRRTYRRGSGRGDYFSGPHTRGSHYR